jgi:hypothetical protein
MEIQSKPATLYGVNLGVSIRGLKPRKKGFKPASLHGVNSPAWEGLAGTPKAKKGT